MKCLDEYFEIYGKRLRRSDFIDSEWKKIKEMQKALPYTMTVNQVRDLRRNPFKKFWCPNSDPKTRHSGCSSIACYDINQASWHTKKNSYPFQSNDHIYVIDVVENNLVLRKIRSFSTYRNSKDWTVYEDHISVFSENQEKPNNIIVVPNLGLKSSNIWFSTRYSDSPVLYKDEDVHLCISKKNDFLTKVPARINLRYFYFYTRNLPSWCRDLENIQEDLRELIDWRKEIIIDEDTLINLFFRKNCFWSSIKDIGRDPRVLYEIRKKSYYINSNLGFLRNNEKYFRYLKVILSFLSEEQEILESEDLYKMSSNYLSGWTIKDIILKTSEKDLEIFFIKVLYDILGWGNVEKFLIGYSKKKMAN